ncbi:hypothetical protein NNA34_12965, partial [Lacticaseibacillus paracasei]|nr:hypothetical protein [Lacticaseibacillus paracasei]
KHHFSKNGQVFFHIFWVVTLIMQSRLQKLQSGLATIGVGAALLIVGYNAQTLEKATHVPDNLLQSLGVVLFAIPAVFSFLAYLIARHYPLQGAARDEMYAALAAKRVTNTQSSKSK